MDPRGFQPIPILRSRYSPANPAASIQPLERGLLWQPPQPHPFFPAPMFSHPMNRVHRSIPPSYDYGAPNYASTLVHRGQRQRTGPPSQFSQNREFTDVFVRDGFFPTAGYDVANPRTRQAMSTNLAMSPPQYWDNFDYQNGFLTAEPTMDQYRTAQYSSNPRAIFPQLPLEHVGNTHSTPQYIVSPILPPPPPQQQQQQQLPMEANTPGGFHRARYPRAMPNNGHYIPVVNSPQPQAHQYIADSPIAQPQHYINSPMPQPQAQAQQYIADSSIAQPQQDIADSPTPQPHGHTNANHYSDDTARNYGSINDDGPLLGQPTPANPPQQHHLSGAEGTTAEGFPPFFLRVGTPVPDNQVTAARRSPQMNPIGSRNAQASTSNYAAQATTSANGHSQVGTSYSNPALSGFGLGHLRHF